VFNRGGRKKDILREKIGPAIVDPRCQSVLFLH
jgi:hypothetical protein